MAGALAKAGVPVELHVFPNGLHGLSVCTYETAAGGSEERVYPYVARWVPWSVRFLENVFRGLSLIHISPFRANCGLPCSKKHIVDLLYHTFPLHFNTSPETVKNTADRCK